LTILPGLVILSVITVAAAYIKWFISTYYVNFILLQHFCYYSVHFVLETR
jgi:hypothetical protein